MPRRQPYADAHRYHPARGVPRSRRSLPLMQLAAIIISIVVTVVAIALAVRAVNQILAVVRVGQPARRTDTKGRRLGTLVREVLGHTRMLKWGPVGAAHWFV